MTIFIIIVTVLVSLSCFNNQELNHRLILNPYTVKREKQWYRLVSSGFQHADYQHLAFNMLALFLFGRTVEVYYEHFFGELGKFIYLIMYVSSIFASNLFTYYKYQDASYYNALGASGAVSAVIFTRILFDPKQEIYFVPGIIFGVLYLVYCHYSSRKQRDNINHDAHFYGAIYGVLFTIVLKPQVASFFVQQLPYIFQK